LLFFYVLIITVNPANTKTSVIRVYSINDTP